MTTTTFSFASENTVLSSLLASAARFFTPAPAPVASRGPSLLSLYRKAGSGDSVRPEVVAALAKMAR